MLKGYRTVLVMIGLLSVAIAQYVAGPVFVSAPLFAVLVPIVGLGMRFITDTPVGTKSQR